MVNKKRNAFCEKVRQVVGLGRDGGGGWKRCWGTGQIDRQRGGEERQSCVGWVG